MAVLGKFNARVDVAGSCFIACYRNFVRGRERRRFGFVGGSNSQEWVVDPWTR